MNQNPKAIIHNGTRYKLEAVGPAFQIDKDRLDKTITVLESGNKVLVDMFHLNVPVFMMKPVEKKGAYKGTLCSFFQAVKNYVGVPDNETLDMTTIGLYEAIIEASLKAFDDNSSLIPTMTVSGLCTSVMRLQESWDKDKKALTTEDKAIVKAGKFPLTKGKAYDYGVVLMLKTTAGLSFRHWV